MNKQRGQTNKQTNKQRDFANLGDLIDRRAALEIGNSLTVPFDEYDQYNHALLNYFAELLQLPSAQPEITLEYAIDYLHSIGWMQKHDKEMTDSAYSEGYTQAEAKYRKMWDEMQANIKEKAFGKRKGLIHTADIDAMPTIEERKTGKWLHTDTESDEEDHYPLGWMPWYCSECGFGVGKHQTMFCPNCGARMVQEKGEDNG